MVANSLCIIVRTSNLNFTQPQNTHQPNNQHCRKATKTSEGFFLFYFAISREESVVRFTADSDW